MSLQCSSSTRVVSSLWPPFPCHSLFLAASLYSCLMLYKGSLHFPPPCRKTYPSLRSCWACLCQLELRWVDFALSTSHITQRRVGVRSLRLHIYDWNSGVPGLDVRSAICIEHLDSLVEKVMKQNLR